MATQGTARETTIKVARQANAAFSYTFELTLSAPPKYLSKQC